MDAKHSGAEVRSACVIQDIRLESSYWDLVVGLIDLIFTCTGDRGPESGLNRTYLPNLDTFPYWRPFRMEPNDDAAAPLELAPDASVDPIISLRGIIDVAGVFHVIDLIEKRLLKEIKSYQTWSSISSPAPPCSTANISAKGFEENA